MAEFFIFDEVKQHNRHMSKTVVLFSLTKSKKQKTLTHIDGKSRQSTSTHNPTMLFVNLKQTLTKANDGVLQ